jgi:hypothetical protein
MAGETVYSGPNRTAGHKKPHVPAQKTAHRCEKNRGGALFFVSSQKSD